MTVEFNDVEYRRTYFDRSLRSCLVELVTACLQHRPGADKADEILPEKYATEVLDPFFQRLAKDCIEKQPADPFSFMQAWTTEQSNVAAKPLVDFVYTWCGSRVDEWKARDRRLAELEIQYASVTEQLQTLLQRPAVENTGLVLTPSANAERIEVLEQKLSESAKREEALCAGIEKLKAEIRNLQAENKTLMKKELDALAQAEAVRKMNVQAADAPRESVAHQEGLGGLACMGVVLKKLMSQGVTSASAAFAFFEPKEFEFTLTREKLALKTIELECLESSEIETLCEYLDPKETGSIVFEDFKAALQSFLATSGDIHSSFSEDEFNTVMARIKDKFDLMGLSVAQVFKDYDSDNSGTLARNEFIEGLSKLRLGLSTKEIAQLFYAMDASGDGSLSLGEFEDAISQGSDNPLLQWAKATFQKMGETLLQGAAKEACAKYAMQPELKAMTHDGFVKLIRENDESLSLTDIGRLWCVVDKLGDSSGNADAAELSKHFTLRLQ
jgi:Ca2+-binding EF-hand superfamily protein